MKLHDFDLSYDMEHESDLVLMMMLQGNQVPIIYNLVTRLKDLEVGLAPKGDDVVYIYHPKMNMTQFIFKGRAWLYPAAQLYDELVRKDVPIIGWSNWMLPFLQKGYLDMGGIDFDELGTEEYPAVGNIDTIDRFIQRHQDVEQEDATETYGALKEALDDDTPLDPDEEIV